MRSGAGPFRSMASERLPSTKLSSQCPTTEQACPLERKRTEYILDHPGMSGVAFVSNRVECRAYVHDLCGHANCACNGLLAPVRDPVPRTAPNSVRLMNSSLSIVDRRSMLASRHYPRSVDFYLPDPHDERGQCRKCNVFVRSIRSHSKITNSRFMRSAIAREAKRTAALTNPTRDRSDLAPRPRRPRGLT
jgi:hypothetical protein